MIQKAPSYITDDDTAHTTIEAAQHHAIRLLAVSVEIDGNMAEQVATFILNHSEKILAILKSTGRKARVKKAAKAPRKSTLKAGEII